MANDRIKVLGYAQRVFFNDGIEYRNFSPDLVGLQLTSEGGTPLFTMGNFSVTTNVEPKKNKTYITQNFSNFVTLTDLDLTLESALSLLTNNAGVLLNLDKSNLTNYALFGSFSEFVRVALENIITSWPAALYANPVYSLAPDYLTQTGFTVENYTYDSVTNVATFKVNTNSLTNNFQINYLANGSLANTFNQDNDMRNLALNYPSYSIRYNNNDFDVLGFTGSTNILNDYLHFTVNGNVFSGAASSDYLVYYIKPNVTQENLFYNALPDFEYYLLNRLVVPQYTAEFKYSLRSEAGNILYVTDSVTWPTSDGYNLDFDTDAYADYATKLLDISANFDSTTSNLMVRFLVTESITNFDTAPVTLAPLDQDTSDQKMNKTLVIYGREYDEINNFISGIQFANTVSYDKKNNIPDIYIKNLARVLGWDLISSVLENDLLASYVHPKPSTYSGQTIGLTAVEADVELWRRIILNTPWIWKSKGTRKSIEFLFKFIGTPLGLISFNEYIYLAENKIDIDLFQQTLALNNLSTDISLYPVSVSGYPQPFPNTADLYFQSKGLWYRETGGDASTMDINTGNNPHIGPYDGGYTYLNQFRTLIPNFSSVTISSETTTTSVTNLFSNYSRGTFTAYSGNTYVDVTTDDGVDFSNCYVVTPQIILDPKHRQDQTNCGCDTNENLRSLSVCIDKTNPNANNSGNQNNPACNNIASIGNPSIEKYYTFNFYQYNPDGSVYTVNGQPVLYSSPFVNKACCNISNSVPYFWNQYIFNTNTNEYELNNSGYICCQANNTCGCLTTCSWYLDPSRTINYNGANYLLFLDEANNQRVVSQDGCNCVAGLTIPVQITDPITQEVGYGCQLTQQGQTDIAQQNSIINDTYDQRSQGNIDCTAVATPPPQQRIPCTMTVNISATQTNGGFSNGTAKATPVGGTAPYTYLWNSAPTQNTQTAVNLPAGTYMVTVTDSLGCQVSSSAIVSALVSQPCTMTASITDNSTSAIANPVGGTAPYSYLWSDGQTTQTATNLDINQSYNVTITDSVGCQATSTRTPARSAQIFVRLASPSSSPDVNLYYKVNNGPWIFSVRATPNSSNYTAFSLIGSLPVGAGVYLGLQSASGGGDLTFGQGLGGPPAGYCGKVNPYLHLVSSQPTTNVYFTVGVQNGNLTQCQG